MYSRKCARLSTERTEARTFVITREWNYSSIQKAIYPKGTRMEQNTQTLVRFLELSTIRMGSVIYKFSPVIQGISTSEKLGFSKNREDPDDYYYYYYHLDQIT